ncbi:MAG TPA: RHS repeat-associated core domain-containing protein [Paraburkholderia sp.]|jgi:RHS repeat-associated protein
MSMQLTGTDLTGSLILYISTSDNSQYDFSYSAFGGTESQDGLPGFNGERVDPFTGVTHLGNGYRAYSPVLMRFTCPDSESPFGEGGINPYAYCNGDPINLTDPDGHGPLMKLFRWVITDTVDAAKADVRHEAEQAGTRLGESKAADLAEKASTSEKVFVVGSVGTVVGFATGEAGAHSSNETADKVLSSMTWLIGIVGLALTFLGLGNWCNHRLNKAKKNSGWKNAAHKIKLERNVVAHMQPEDILEQNVAVTSGGVGPFDASSSSPVAEVTIESGSSSSSSMRASSETNISGNGQDIAEDADTARIPAKQDRSASQKDVKNNQASSVRNQAQQSFSVDLSPTEGEVGLRNLRDGPESIDSEI